MKREDARLANDQFGLLNALLLTCSCAAVFITSDVAYDLPNEDPLVILMLPYLQKIFLFAWCSSLLGFLTGTLAAAMLNLVVGEMRTEEQYRHLSTLLGNVENIPFLTILFGIAMIWVGLISYVLMIFHLKFTLCCLAACSIFLWCFWFMSSKIAWAFNTVHTTQKHLEGHLEQQKHMIHSKNINSVADVVYQDLETYFKGECDGCFSHVDKVVFLDRYYHQRYKPILALANAIFDDWYSKIIQSAIRDDPGF